MTKDVLLRIQGLQFLQEENENPEPVEMITSGDYYKRNGKHYVLYDEVMEGFDGVTKNIVKIQDGCLDVMKKGAHGIREEQKEHHLLQYSVWKPYDRH